MGKRSRREAELTDEQIAAEEKFLEGLPRVNLGAFLMPGIWGPAHGFWACILFYPLYLFADNMLFAAYTSGETWTFALAVLMIVVLFGIHLAFSLISQPLAAHRADNRGVSRATYLRRERIWAVIGIVVAVVALAWATYYNLEIRVTLGQ